MSASESEGRSSRVCECDKNQASGCEICTAPKKSEKQLGENQMINIMISAISKIDALSSHVKGLEGRLSSLEVNSGYASGRSNKLNKKDRKSI